MKKLLTLFVWPGVPYPLGAVAHLVLGAIIGCIPPQLAGGTTEDAVTGAYIGAAVGIVLGFVLWLVLRPANLNKR